LPKPKSRGNGQGSAFKRGNTWTAQIVVGWKGASPVKKTKGGFATKKDAINYCAVLRSDTRPVKKPKQLIKYWENYQDNEYQRLSKSQQCSYRIAWNKLKPLHYRYIDSITVQDLREVVSKACPTFYTAKDCKNLLANLFNLAAGDGAADRDLPSYIILPEKEYFEREAFTPEEQAALWKLYESGDMDAAIPLLMIYTGAMPGEVRDTKIENIDLEKKMITGVGLKTKTRKESPILLSDTIIPVVESLIEHATKKGYLWKRMKKEWYDQYYAALEKAGCRKLSPYSCRHTTATALAINENIAPQTVRRIMRWSSTKMMNVYTHPDMDHLFDAVNSMKKD